MAGDLPLFDPFKALAEIRRQNAERLERELSQKLSQPPARANHECGQVDNPTLATLATLAGGIGAHELAPARVKEEERKENLIKSYTYAGDRAARDGNHEHARTEVARVARVARVELSDCKTEDIAETAVARVLGHGLKAWYFGLALLNPVNPPCPGYRADEWSRVYSRAHIFLDQFGRQAEALGWTSSRLFGVHSEAGIIRVDACGALALPVSGEVRAITDREVRFDHLTHREKPGQPQGVPWWDFGR